MEAQALPNNYINLVKLSLCLTKDRAMRICGRRWAVASRNLNICTRYTEWPASRPGRFTAWRMSLRYSLHVRLNDPQTWSRHKYLSLPDIKPRSSCLKSNHCVPAHWPPRVLNLVGMDNIDIFNSILFATYVKTERCRVEWCYQFYVLAHNIYVLVVMNRLIMYHVN
jgi:hypothetical protein